MPMTGKTRYNQLKDRMLKPAVSIISICLMRLCRMKAATAAKNPTKKLNARMNCRSERCCILQLLSFSASEGVFSSVSVMTVRFDFQVCYLLMTSTSPFCLSLTMEEGVCGFFSCRLEVQT